MLEGLVATLLNRFLGMYVENFDVKQLNIGIWSGDVKLRNLQLRKEALDQLRLPLNVIKGHLGQLTLQIPWSNLRGKPVRVTIEDIFLLAAPKEDAEYDQEEEEARAHAVKMEKLENAELLKERNAEGMSPEDQQKNQTFTTTLVTAIANNLQVTVKNIHIRYEDTIADPGHPFALGITMQSFSAISTDDKWKPTFVQSSSGTTHKLATLDALAVYWDTDSKLLSMGKGSQAEKEKQKVESTELLSEFKKLIVGSDESTLKEHQFVLKPVNGRAGLEIDNTGRLDHPKFKARLLFEELGFIVDADQYRDALMLVDLFHYFLRHQEYKKYQPKSTPKEDPKAWLRFAGTAILNKIHERNRRWTWEYFKERRDDRRRYINLFKKQKKDETISPSEQEELSKLEKKLSYEDLRFWRSLARNQLRKENAGVKKTQPSQTWSQWLWGGGGQKQEEASDEAQMSEEQRKELYNAIDWDEKKALSAAVDVPKDVVKAQVEMNLRTGSFTLKQDPHGKGTQILRLLFDSFTLKFLQRPDSFLAETSLGGMRLYDGTTPGSLFPQIIKVKQQSELVTESEAPVYNEEKDIDSDMLVKETSEDNFFFMAFENNPLDGSADTALSMKLKGIEIVYNPRLVIEVVQFFKPPERHMESVSALLESAGAAVEGLRQQTRAGLEYALEEHKTINAHLDLQAPLIIIPDSVTKTCRLCLIIDAGHAKLNSDLIDKATMREIQSKQKQKYTDEDFRRLENLMYDKFLLKLDSTQVLIGKSIEETRSQLEATKSSTSKKMQIVDKINIDFQIQTCIVPKASGLTKFRIQGHLPILHVSISDEKYKGLMRLIDVAIPKFEEDAPSNQAISAPQSDALAIAGETNNRDDLDVEASDSDEENSRDRDDKGQQIADPQNLFQRKNFEFKFTVDRLQGSLYKSSTSEMDSDQLLVDLIAEQFQLSFYQRPFDIAADVSLKALTLEDNVEKNTIPEFRNIVSSKNSSDLSESELFTLKFIKVDSKSPEFDKVYGGISINLEVSMSTINLVITRKTILTLLDFTLQTFTGDSKKVEPDRSKIEDKAPEAEEGGNESTIENEGYNKDKIRIKADLQLISIILNNDGIRLATASLKTATVDLLINGDTLQMSARLGNLSLIDDVNQGVSPKSPLRQLVSIEGDELAHLKYETFDPQSSTYPGYNSSIYLRSGSLKVNFLTEPFRKIMDFSVKFGKMQSIFNAARQAAAQQATQIQENAGKLHFDILIRTPIIVFPKMVVTDEPDRDQLTANLGEIYASNKFEKLDNPQNTETANKISAGIRNIQMTSKLHFEHSTNEELEMIDKVNLHFDIIMIDQQIESRRPEIEVRGSLSKVHFLVTQKQLKFILELSRTIPAAFAAESVELSDQEIDEALPQGVSRSATFNTNSESSSTSNKEVVTSQSPEVRKDDGSNIKIDLIFTSEAVALELVSAPDNEPVEDAKNASLSVFSLNETNVKMRMISDGSVEAELLIRSFTVEDTRSQVANKFRKIMSLINKDVKQQFMANFTMTGGDSKSTVIIFTIDSPKIILALDYVFAVQTFFTKATEVEEKSFIEQEEDGSDDAEDDFPENNADNDENGKPSQSSSDSNAMDVSFRLNLVDAQIILLANPTISNSEAIVLGTKHVLAAKQHATTLQVDKIGMFLCRMDKFKTSRLRILDDFSMQSTVQMQADSQTTPFVLISINIEPLVLRLSLRDILLVTQTLTRASEMSQPKENTAIDTEPTKLKEIKGTVRKSGPTSTKKHAVSTINKSRKPTVATQVQGRNEGTNRAHESGVVKKEEMTVEIQGIRVVLIGNTHELPMLDWSVKKFAVDIRDWSAAMVMDSTVHTWANVYNFSKSTWEPLMEPWDIGYHLSKEQETGMLSADLFSRKSAEMTFTTATIALALQSAQFLSADEDVLSKPRGIESPYRLRNYTGYDIFVWAVSEDSENGRTAKVLDGEEIPWRFEDPSTTRETLASEGATGVIGLKIEESGYDRIERIAVNREAENLYSLLPKKEGIQHRLAVEIKLGADSVKYVTFRSPLKMENETRIPLDMAVFDVENGDLLKITTIPPGESRPAPIGVAYLHSLLLRPNEGFGYLWSTDRLYWRNVMKQPVKTLVCQRENSRDFPPFVFQTCGLFDKKSPITKVYPHMTIKVTAPVEVQNLLPYDLTYSVFDKSTKREWSNFLRKGGVSPVHAVQLTHLLLMKIDIEGIPIKPSEFAVINSPSGQELRRDKTMHVKDEHGQELRLKLHHFNVQDSGGAFRVSIYSPYVILNRTALPLQIKSKALFGTSKAATGHGTINNEDMQQTRPFLFSFPTDDQKNRALIRIGDSAWSKPQSLDAIGSTYETGLTSHDGKSTMHVGVAVDEGEGKYKLSKIITVSPRYILCNKMSEDLTVREPGMSEVLELKAGELLPIRYLRQGRNKQLCLCFKGIKNQWSAPFTINDIGRVHVKLSKAGERQRLLRVEILVEQATIFLHMSLENNHWPFSFRNESDVEFLLYQANPFEDEDETNRESGWRPIKYRLPPRSIMPYAWDFPAAKYKEIVLASSGKERRVKLAEIGNLIPMRLPPINPQSPTKIIDLNVVADGPTQTLAISNYKASKSIYKPKKGLARQSTSTGFEVKDQDIGTNFRVNVRVAGLGLSLINSQLRELIYLTLREIELKYTESKLLQNVNATIKWIQIDNQLYGGIFPLLLYPSVVPKSGKEMEAHPILNVAVTRVKDDSYGVLYIKYFTFLLQQMTIEVDEDFMFALLEFLKIPGATWSEEKEDKLCDEYVDIPEPEQETSSQDVYFEMLHLQPMQFDLSFVRTERINADDTMSISNPLLFAVNVLTMSIGNVNDAPLRYNALILENARVSVAGLVSNIRSHYVQESLQQVHIVLGSADFLGNPVGLFNNISSGVADIFYEPYQGLVMTDRPQELGIGIAKGASSFVKKSVFGVTDSMAKFTGSMSKGLAAATLDKDFQTQRRMAKSRNRPKHALYGITSGGNAFASSLASGIGGLARHPLEGAEKEGFQGFVKGVGKGFLGLATKPAIGAFDLASNVAEGVRNTTTVFDQDGLDRVRLPRFIGVDGVVRPYSQREALGQFWLKTLDNGNFFKEEYIAHLELPGKDMIVMLTYKHIMLVKTRKLSSEWNLELRDIQTIIKERAGMSIVLKGGNNGPFIPVADEVSRNWLYRQIAIAVNAYNEKYNTKA